MRWKDRRRSENVIDLRHAGAWLPIEQLGPIQSSAVVEVEISPVLVTTMNGDGMLDGRRAGVDLKTVIHPDLHSSITVLRRAGFEVNGYQQSAHVFALAFEDPGKLLDEKLTLHCHDNNVIFSAQTIGPIGRPVLLDWGYAEQALGRAVNAIARSCGCASCSFIYH